MEELQKKKVAELKELARIHIGRGFSNLRRKQELVEELSNIPEVMEEMRNLQRQRPILDEPIPNIDVKILKPKKPKPPKIPIKNLESRVEKPIIKDINEFADWIQSYIPEPSKKIVDKRIESMKEEFNKIFKRFNQKENLNEKADQIRKRFAPKESLKERFIRTFKKPVTEYGKEFFTFNEQQKALDGYLKTFRIDGKKGYGPKTFINKIKPKVMELINKQKKPIKIKFIFTCKFTKENLNTKLIEENSGYFHSTVEIITESTDFTELYNTMTNYLLGKVEKFQNQGSGWVFSQVEYFDINIDPFEPISGSSYIELPPKLAKKKAIINVKNENDQECFKWAVTSAVFPKEKFIHKD